MFIKIWYIILVLLLLEYAIAVTGVDRGAKFDIFKRNLASWSSHSTCTSCNSDSSWEFSKGVCSNSPASTISSSNFNQIVDYKYCENAHRSGYIDLTGAGNKELKMSSLVTRDVSAHPLWEWNIKTDSKFKHKLIVKRDPQNYEDLHIKIMKNDKSEIYTSKNFSNCTASSYELDIGGATFVVIKAYQLDDKSRYTITLKKNTNALVIPLFILILIPILLGLIVIITILAITYFWIKAKIRKKRRREQQYEQERRNREKRDSRIIEAMENMKHGLIVNMPHKYQQTNCIICLENFKSTEPFDHTSEVHVTNECSHIFHTNWLAEWFATINPKKDLTWPLWNTVITNTSSPLDEGAINVSTQFG